MTQSMWAGYGCHFRFVCYALEFCGLWQVAVVHRFHCRSDVSRGCERVSLPRWLRERLWPRVSTWRASSLSLPCSSCASFSFAASPLRRFFTQDLSISLTCEWSLLLSAWFARRSGRISPRSQFFDACTFHLRWWPCQQSLRRIFARRATFFAGLRHVALVSLCSPARLSICGFLRSFSSFVAILFFTGRPRREARRDCVRSNARPSKGRSVCTREARKIEVPRRLWANKVLHSAHARAQAGTYKPVHVAMWCSCFCGGCPSSKESGTTHRERKCMLTKRHTTLALARADRK